MSDTWICSNCGAENSLKFCTKCGAPKPVVEIPEADAPQMVDTWDCICGNTGNTGKFCKKCGRSRAEGTVIEAVISENEIPQVEEAVPEVEVPEVEVPELEIPEVETPEVEVPQMEIPEVEIPEAEIPEVEIPKMEVSEDNTWTCICGQTGNVGKFCKNCGSPRPLANVVPAAAVAAGLTGQETPEETPKAEGPQLEIPSDGAPQENTPVLRVAAPPEGPWDCPCGKTGNLGKFCSVCGTPRERGFAPDDGTASVPPIAVQPEREIKTGMEEPAMREPEIIQPEAPKETGKKKRSFKLLIILIAAVVVVAAVVVALIFLLPKKSVVNKYDPGEILEVKEGFKVVSDDYQDISFLYPSDLLADIQDGEDYIYNGNKGDFPYIVIQRMNTKTTAKDYFKELKEYAMEVEPDLSFSDVQKMTVGSKTVYKVDATFPEDGLNVQEFIELYEDCYVTYTCAGYELGTDIPELNSAIESLRLSATAYPMPQLLTYENYVGNFSVEIPDDYTVDEFSSGLFADKDNAGLFAAYFNSDLFGTIIYDWEDFITRAGKIDSYVAELIGVEEATLSQGTTTKIDGREFYVCPIEVTLQNGASAEGELAVGNCDRNVGVYLIGYYLDENTGSIEAEEGSQFLQSMMIYGEPNNTFYQKEDAEAADLGIFACDSDQLGDVKVESNSVTITSPDGKQKVILEKMEGPTVYEAAGKIAQDLANQYNESQLFELEDPEDGRYYYHGAEITYETDKGEKHVYRIIGIESSIGNIYCMHYDVVEGEEEWADSIVDDLIWSWKLN